MCEPLTSSNVNLEPKNQDFDAGTSSETLDNKTVIEESEILPADSDIVNVAVKEKSIINEDNPYDFFAQSRQVLPGRIIYRRFSVWSYLKEFVGRDLTRITLPINMNEPLSLLHKYPESFGSSKFMQKMLQASDPVERIERIAAYFAVSQSSVSYRIFKPFNPLLGETFEFRRKENNLLFVTEQVSHHPPITAFYSHMPKLKAFGSYNLWIKFGGNSIETIVDGTFTYEFLDSNGSVETVITIVPPVTTARNIIFGNIWLERLGVVPIIDHTSGHRLMLNFKKKGWFSSRDLYVVEGMIVDEMGIEKRYVYGHWTNEVWSCSPETYRRFGTNESQPKGPDSKLLARAIPKLPNSEHYFNMPKASIALNEKTPDMNLPPTDTRLRPDIVALEHGDMDLASAEKHRLEEKQRAARRLRESNGDTWVPMWFELKPNSILNRDEWLFNDKYLEQKFENCPDIY